MYQFSTILFVEGHPVKYDISLNDVVASLHPSENPNSFLVPPLLQAQKSSDAWQITGTADRDLIDQVIEELEWNQNKYTAA